MHIVDFVKDIDSVSEDCGETGFGQNVKGRERGKNCARLQALGACGNNINNISMAYR